MRRMPTTSYAAIAAMALAIAGCGRSDTVPAHDDHAGHDHGHEREPSGHDHGHEHAETGAHDHADHLEREGHGDHPAEGEHADEVTLPAHAIERWNIQVEPVRKRVLTERFVVPARVRFNQERIAHVGSVVAGRVAEWKARVGDEVKRGEPLLVVASPEFGQAQSEFLQRRTEAETAEQMIQVARQAYERAKRLHDQNQSIALAEVQQREGELRAAEGQARSARAGATAAENTLRLLGMDQAAVQALVESNEITQRYVVTTPIDGVVVQREPTLGESVGPDTEALAVVANMETLWVVADVPEDRVGGVAVNQPSSIRTPGPSGRAIEGKVSYIAPRLSPETRTVPVRIEVPGDEGLLRPGMFVEVELARTGGSGGEAVLAVPEAALQMIEGEPSVFVAVEGEPNTFAKRVVEVGRPIGGISPVLDGLREGDPVVVNGSFLLKADLGKAGAAHEH